MNTNQEIDGGKCPRGLSHTMPAGLATERWSKGRGVWPVVVHYDGKQITRVETAPESELVEHFGDMKWRLDHLQPAYRTFVLARDGAGQIAQALEGMGYSVVKDRWR